MKSFRFEGARRDVLIKDLSNEEIAMLERVAASCIKEKRDVPDLGQLAALEEHLRSALGALSGLHGSLRRDLGLYLWGREQGFDYTAGKMRDANGANGVFVINETPLGLFEGELGGLHRHVEDELERRKPGPGRPREYERWYRLLYALNQVEANVTCSDEVLAAALEADDPSREAGERPREMRRYFDRLLIQDHIDRNLRFKTQ